MKDTESAIRALPGSDWIETYRGRHFSIENPVFDADEIAHALGNLCRFNGHCRRFYSVAEHSLLVASLTEHLHLGDPFEALMHDAHEAYVSDLAAPWKSRVPEFKERLEHPAECKMRVHYGLQPTISPGIKFADWVALMIEAKNLLPSKGKGWSYAPAEAVETANQLHRGIKLNLWAPDLAADMWRATFNELGGPRGFSC